MRSSPVVATAVALFALLAGCTEQTSGDPSASGEPTGTSEQPTDEPTTTPSESGGGVADLQPCDILEPADVQGLQLTGGEEKEVSGARVCRYRYEGATLNDSFTVSVELFDGIGLDDLNVDDIQPMKVGGHDGASFTDPGGGCGVSIGVTDTSRVDNTAVGGENQELACRLATQLATAVEKRLP
ncbi:DUF3558 domain-containing protein [Actinophytocola oryzae]|uniref:Uncharacterized protein DUF3558 n=1 Tax=Actinophytocola oryzae TaxID=502181 RepID=A0A4R7UTT2_9PSEU|nr:DUF3558 domain-containing protein [Actinophytocola oryzae]TDV40049.1 uncharacterized protein DUF3558 [Actinophytocola oryzae]